MASKPGWVVRLFWVVPVVRLWLRNFICLSAVAFSLSVSKILMVSLNATGSIIPESLVWGSVG
jgi:hypothetical protein